MNKKILVVGIIAFIMGLSANYAFSDIPLNFNVAVVDVPTVVSSSSQVKALKTEQTAKNNEIIKFVMNARKEVAKVSDKKKRNTLEDKYNAQLRAMKKSMEDSYKKRLTGIDNSIKNAVEKTAQNAGYSVVFAKGAVLYGGDDITKEIVAVVK